MSQQTARRGGAAWALVITSVAGFMAALDNLVVTTALPSIREDLGGGLHDLEWTVSAYTLTFAVLLMFGAALGDRFGRRRLFIAGLAVFTGAPPPPRPWRPASTPSSPPARSRASARP
ncbi:MFS family permease [Streptomyces luteogriseus]|nr:MFS family permease [Streptomyces luteogriseus]